MWITIQLLPHKIAPAGGTVVVKRNTFCQLFSKECLKKTTQSDLAYICHIRAAIVFPHLCIVRPTQLDLLNNNLGRHSDLKIYGKSETGCTILFYHACQFCRNVLDISSASEHCKDPPGIC